MCMLISIPRPLRSLYGHQKSYATPASHARPTHVFPQIGPNFRRKPHADGRAPGCKRALKRNIDRVESV